MTQLDLVSDGLRRAARTLFWAALVALVVAWVLSLEPHIDVGYWQLLGTMLVGAVIQAACSFLHRVALDPTNLPTLEPVDTPRFQEPPLDPPVPFG